ncbi:hypothetical protein DL766_008445 [Monosporascus sp. MC13-8B]|nr:hypothetical protein DL763_004339 [Monosporascus cannonballus]RYP19435.1 hypothetical protein DL766_008445 [Monosporascus sp. MC13-8B]
MHITILITYLITTVLGAPSQKSYAHRTSGCGRVPPFAASRSNDFRTAEGRLFHVWLPETYHKDNATPMILSFHGAGGNVTQQMAVDDLTNHKFNRDHIVVYMQGDTNDDGGTTWQGAPGAEADDIGFTTEVIDFAQRTFCIDEARTYATGKSQGGGFVGRLACDPALSRRIAAFAPVSGAYYIREVAREEDCDPRVVQIPYGGDFRRGACLPAVPHWAELWARRNGLDGTSQNTSIPQSANGVDMDFGGGLVRLVYDGDDVGHVWPESGNAAFDASSWIMDFFRRHSLD